MSEVEPKRELHFTWDEEGGAHVQHDEELTVEDLQEAFGALGCIIAHNLYIEGGLDRVAEWMMRIPGALKVYLQGLMAGETRGTRIERLSSGTPDRVAGEEEA